MWNYEEGASTIPSSAVAGDILYAPSSGITAIQPAGNAVQKRWRNEQVRPKTASPVAAAGRIYFPEGGVLTALNAENGERLWKTRVQGDYSASPVIANGHLYLVNEAGTVQIIPLDPAIAEPGIVSELPLAETVLCTPAISGGAIYVRSDGHLWKLANPGS